MPFLCYRDCRCLCNNSCHTLPILLSEDDNEGYHYSRCREYPADGINSEQGFQSIEVIKYYKNIEQPETAYAYNSHYGRQGGVSPVSYTHLDVYKRQMRGLSPCNFLLYQLALTDYLSCTASTPGSALPSRNSREAPPPVEIWLI